MMNPDWEDSLASFDLRDLVHGEAIDRFLMTASHLASTCHRAPCRRHGLCLGPMCQKPGARLPGPLMQLGPNGFRPSCLQGPKPPFELLKSDIVKVHGAICLAALETHFPGIDTRSFLGRRIEKSRAARAPRIRDVGAYITMTLRDTSDRINLIRPDLWSRLDESFADAKI